ncbi:MAG: hypothetical protein VKS61_05960 [Candidatus Sericytochromatia bacterium]|nr:hypothetical protein [Candidatus Sericytochromatia bacterium]
MLDLFDLDPKDRLVAQLLQSQGLINAEQLRRSLERSRRSLFLSLSEILIGEGCVTLERLETVLQDYCKKLRLGELALARGLISEENLELALAVQGERDVRIGEIFVELHLATPEQIGMLVDFQQRCRLDFAELEADAVF